MKLCLMSEQRSHKKEPFLEQRHCACESTAMHRRCILRQRAGGCRTRIMHTVKLALAVSKRVFS